MNHTLPHNTKAYQAAQSALGPVSETLQVEGAILSLRSAIEYHEETVGALLRRLHPVTGDVAGVDSEAPPTQVRVPLAYELDGFYARLHSITTDVQNAIRALQI